MNLSFEFESVIRVNEWAGTSFLVEVAIPQGVLRQSPYENSDGDCKTMTLLVPKSVHAPLF